MNSLGMMTCSRPVAAAASASTARLVGDGATPWRVHTDTRTCSRRPVCGPQGRAF